MQPSTLRHATTRVPATRTASVSHAVCSSGEAGWFHDFELVYNNATWGDAPTNRRR